jgi:transcriptional regulator with XRE-family HTH domain
VFSAYVNQIALGNLSEFARLLGMAKSKVWPWYSGKGVPSLDTLLQICHRFGVSVPDFLCKETVDVSQKIALTGFGLHQPVSSNKQPFDLDKMRRELLAALEETPPPCLKDVALRIGCCKTTLYNKFPDLIHTIAARHNIYRKTCHEELIERISQEVYQVAVELHAKQIEPTNRRVVEKLTKPGAIRNKEIRAALHKVRSELGWEVAKLDS